MPPRNTQCQSRYANRTCEDAARELLEWAQKNIDPERATKLLSFSASLQSFTESVLRTAQNNMRSAWDRLNHSVSFAPPRPPLRPINRSLRGAADTTIASASSQHRLHASP
jgi:hypothetical protein